MTSRQKARRALRTNERREAIQKLEISVPNVNIVSVRDAPGPTVPQEPESDDQANTVPVL